ncbi:magnesium/cobalt transporter CorA [Rhizobium panacihumi]|uniref:magnesium/cobalt transporter CorA n=1 Tax=Rhizobium panacihumi TaxID=2008450 RepID=UPI003D7A0358
MLKIYPDGPDAGSLDGEGALPEGVIWIDLLNPSAQEIAFVEQKAKVHVPSREDLSEIEVSSRLAKEGDHLYLSAPVIGHATLEHAELSPAGFIVGKDLLITIRFENLPTFDAVVERLRHDKMLTSGFGVFIALLEAIVDRGADVLEHIATAVDEVSRSVFKGNLRGSISPRSTNLTLRNALAKVGALGDRSSKARDVLLGVGRIAAFTVDICHEMLTDEARDQLHAVTKDVTSLSDYETHLSDKTQFLLDAVLGFITIEQNDIFKVLTIASVVGVPPTLMAGIWGMNFKFMPELGWTWGYPFAWAIIILSAIVPLLWFWRKGWF